MNLTIYVTNIEGPGTEIKVLCESIASPKELRVFNSIESLTDWLVITMRDQAIVILVAQTKDELTELLPIIHLFHKVQIILILPNREPETIRIGYRLEPRYLSFIDSGVEALKAILRKMLKGPEVRSRRKVTPMAFLDEHL